MEHELSIQWHKQDRKWFLFSGCSYRFLPNFFLNCFAAIFSETISPWDSQCDRPAIFVCVVHAGYSTGACAVLRKLSEWEKIFSRWVIFRMRKKHFLMLQFTTLRKVFTPNFPRKRLSKWKFSWSEEFFSVDWFIQWNQTWVLTTSHRSAMDQK